MGKRSEKINLEDFEYTEGSGNVYADFGIANPEEAKTKADLAMLITDTIKERGLTQQEAADKMGIDQPKISKIMRGLLTDFSIERLMALVLSLGFDIELRATPHKAKKTAPAIHVVGSMLHRKRTKVCYKSC